MLKRMLLLFVIAFALLPATVAAQAPDDGETYDTLIRIDGRVHVPAGETAQGVIVVNDDALIEGTVDYLVVIGGDATIAGTVKRQVYMVNGTVTLRDGARVEEEILLYNADAVEAAGATVVGGVHEEWGGFTVTRGFWLGLWLSMTVAVLAAGMLFAAFGGRQLTGAVTAVTGHAGPTVLTTLILWIGVPILAVLVMATVVGIPLALGVLLFLLPALWFMGYLVAGAAVGTLIFRTGQGDGVRHPYLPVLVGLLIVQAVALIPYVGGTIAFVAGLIGAGALAYRMWAGFRGTTTERPAFAPTAPAAPRA